MPNATLWKQGIKSLYKIFLVFLLVAVSYIAVIIYMFDPELGSALNDFYISMPELMSMFGMVSSTTTMVEFLASYVYGFLMFIVPMALTIIAANRLVARHVDRGSMGYLLAAPHTRAKVAFTQLAVLLTVIFAFIALCTIITIACCGVIFPGELDVVSLLKLNVGLLCLHLAIGGICFFASCISNETKTSLALGAGIPCVFYLVEMLANIGGKLENLEYVTIFTLFDPDGFIAGEANAWFMAATLLVLAILLYIFAIIIFRRRDLPL